jgi:hypothetical protein
MWRYEHSNPYTSDFEVQKIEARGLNSLLNPEGLSGAWHTVGTQERY